MSATLQRTIPTYSKKTWIGDYSGQVASVSERYGDQPDIIVFGGALNSNYTLRKSIILNVVVEDGRIILCDDIFNMYGMGKTIPEALEDYKITLIEYYELNESLPDAPTSKRFDFIKNIIAKN
jgi:hypothetical protein